MILLISAFSIARITGVSHQGLAAGSVLIAYFPILVIGIFFLF
jgi:hypothetical protein